MDDIIFKTLTLDEIIAHREYFEKCNFRISDYSASFKFMWQKVDCLEYAFVENCLIFKVRYGDSTYFYYPLSLGDEQDEIRALDCIERYCLTHKIRLQFAYVSREKIQLMVERYGVDVRITSDRRWSDYLYTAEKFKSYSGKKLSGQRNHVNKFKKSNPDYYFVTLTGSDSAEIFAFLKRFEERQLNKNNLYAKEELQGVYDLLPYIDKLHLLVGAIKYKGEIIAVSMGERVGDTLIICVEKALVEYDGIYQTIAQEFAKKFATDGVEFINREDDSGDAGLRKSKLQYYPVRLVNKYEVYPTRLIDRVERLPVIASNRVTLKEIDQANALEFYRLEHDVERNKFWGYDWRTEFKEEPTPEYFISEIRKDFDSKNEMPLGIYLGSKLLGEVVLHNFGYAQECEVGVRVLPEFEGQGYASEAVITLTEYALMELGAQVVNAKCMKANVRSAALFNSIGFRPCGEDKTFYYFEKTSAM